MGRLENQLAALATMSPAQLRAEWLRVHKAPAPKATPDLLTRGIAYRLQVQAYGGLAPAVKRQLKQLTEQLGRKAQLGRSYYEGFVRDAPAPVGLTVGNARERRKRLRRGGLRLQRMRLRLRSYFSIEAVLMGVDASLSA